MAEDEEKKKPKRTKSGGLSRTKSGGLSRTKSGSLSKTKSSSSKDGDDKKKKKKVKKEDTAVVSDDEMEIADADGGADANGDKEKPKKKTRSKSVDKKRTKKKSSSSGDAGDTTDDDADLADQSNHSKKKKTRSKSVDKKRTKKKASSGGDGGDTTDDDDDIISSSSKSTKKKKRRSSSVSKRRSSSTKKSKEVESETAKVSSSVKSADVVSSDDDGGFTTGDDDDDDDSSLDEEMKAALLANLMMDDDEDDDKAPPPAEEQPEPEPEAEPEPEPEPYDPLKEVPIPKPNNPPMDKITLILKRPDTEKMYMRNIDPANTNIRMIREFLQKEYYMGESIPRHEQRRLLYRYKPFCDLLTFDDKTHTLTNAKKGDVNEEDAKTLKDFNIGVKGRQETITLSYMHIHVVSPSTFKTMMINNVDPMYDKIIEMRKLALDEHHKYPIENLRILHSEQNNREVTKKYSEATFYEFGIKHNHTLILEWPRIRIFIKVPNNDFAAPRPVQEEEVVVKKDEEKKLAPRLEGPQQEVPDVENLHEYTATGILKKVDAVFRTAERIDKEYEKVSSNGLSTLTIRVQAELKTIKETISTFIEDHGIPIDYQTLYFEKMKKAGTKFTTKRIDLTDLDKKLADYEMKEGDTVEIVPMSLTFNYILGGVSMGKSVVDDKFYANTIVETLREYVSRNGLYKKDLSNLIPKGILAENFTLKYKGKLLKIEQSIHELGIRGEQDVIDIEKVRITLKVKLPDTVVPGEPTEEGKIIEISVNPKSDDPTTIKTLVERKTDVPMEYIQKLIDSKGDELDDPKKKLLDYGIRENDVIEIPPMSLTVVDVGDSDATYQIDDLNPYEDTINNLELKISELTKIAPGKQLLHHKNQNQDLNDDKDNGRTFPDCNIMHNDTIVLKAQPVVVQVKLPKGCKTRKQYLDPDYDPDPEQERDNKQEFSTGDQVKNFGDVDEDDGPAAQKPSGKSRNVYLDADCDPDGEQRGQDKRPLSQGDNVQRFGAVEDDDDDKPSNGRPSGRSRDAYLDAENEPDDKLGRDKRELTKGDKVNRFGDVDKDDDDENPNSRKAHGSRDMYLDADGEPDADGAQGGKRELNRGDKVRQFGDIDEDDESPCGRKDHGSRDMYFDADSEPDAAGAQEGKRNPNIVPKLYKFGDIDEDDVIGERGPKGRSRNMYFDYDQPEMLSVHVDPRKDTLDTFKKRVFQKLGLPEDSKNLPMTRLFVADMIGPDEDPKKVKLDAPDGNTILSDLDILDDCTFELEPSTVKLKTGGGREFEFVVYPTDTVDDVNERVKRTLGIPMNKQRFTNIDEDDDEADIDVGSKGGRALFMDLEGVNDGDTLLVTRKDIAITFKTPPGQEDLEVIIDPKIHNNPQKIRAFIFDSIGLPIEYQEKLKFKGEKLGKKELDELDGCEVELEPMQIEVKPAGGRPFFLEVLPTDDIEEVKRKFTGIPFEKQVWTVEGDDEENPIGVTKSKGSRQFVMDFLNEGDTVNIEKGKVATKLMIPGREKPIECYLDPKRDSLQRVREFIFDAYAIPEGDRERFSSKMPLSHKGQILEKNTLVDLGEDDVIELVPDLTVNVKSGGRMFPVDYLPFDTLDDIKRKVDLGVPSEQQRVTLNDSEEEIVDVTDDGKTKTKSRAFAFDFIKEGDTVNVKKSKIPIKVKVPNLGEVEVYVDPKRDSLDRVRNFVMDFYEVPEEKRGDLAKRMPLHHKGQVMDQSLLGELDEDDEIELIPLDVKMKAGGRVFNVDIIPFEKIDDVKKRIEKMVGVHSDIQRFTLDDEEIQPEELEGTSSRPRREFFFDVDVGDDQIISVEKKRVNLNIKTPDGLPDLNVEVDPRYDTPDRIRQFVFDMVAPDLTEEQREKLKDAIPLKHNGTVLDIRRLAEVEDLEEFPIELEPAKLNLKSGGRIFTVDYLPIESIDDVKKRVEKIRPDLPAAIQRWDIDDDDDIDDNVDDGKPAGPRRFIFDLAIDEGATVAVKKKLVKLHVQMPTGMDPITVEIDPRKLNSETKVRQFIFDTFVPDMPDEEKAKIMKKLPPLKHKGSVLDFKKLDDIEDIEDFPIELETTKINLNSGGRIFAVDVLPIETIDDVKKRVEKVHGIPFDVQRWEMPDTGDAIGEDDDDQNGKNAKPATRRFIFDSHIDEGTTVNIKKKKICMSVKTPAGMDDIELRVDPKDLHSVEKIRSFVFDMVAPDMTEEQRLKAPLPIKHKGELLDVKKLKDLDDDLLEEFGLELEPTEVKIKSSSTGRVFTVETLPFETVSSLKKRVAKTHLDAGFEVQRWIDDDTGEEIGDDGEDGDAPTTKRFVSDLDLSKDAPPIVSKKKKVTLMVKMPKGFSDVEVEVDTYDDVDQIRQHVFDAIPEEHHGRLKLNGDVLHRKMEGRIDKLQNFDDANAPSLEITVDPPAIYLIRMPEKKEYSITEFNSTTTTLLELKKEIAKLTNLHPSKQRLINPAKDAEYPKGLDDDAILEDVGIEIGDTLHVEMPSITLKVIFPDNNTKELDVDPRLDSLQTLRDFVYKEYSKKKKYKGTKEFLSKNLVMMSRAKKLNESKYDANAKLITFGILRNQDTIRLKSCFITLTTPTRTVFCNNSDPFIDDIDTLIKVLKEEKIPNVDKLKVTFDGKTVEDYKLKLYELNIFDDSNVQFS